MLLTCPCGAIELKVEGKPLAQFYCHCDDCRKMTSGAYAAESVHRATDVTVTRGSPAVWTLARNPRHYCATCGGRLFIEVASLQMRGVNAFLFRRASRAVSPAVSRELQLRRSPCPGRPPSLREDAGCVRWVRREGRLVARTV